jgi:hypothetical protein
MVLFFKITTWSVLFITTMDSLSFSYIFKDSEQSTLAYLPVESDVPRW